MQAVTGTADHFSYREWDKVKEEAPRKRDEDAVQFAWD